MLRVKCLLVFLSISVSLTEIINVFEKVGSVVRMDVQSSSSYEEIIWWFNSETRVVKYDHPNVKIEPEYKDRIEFSTETYSLTLKNVQKNDNGVYQAETVINSKKHFPVNYSLSVLDPVEKPKLQVYYENGSCNVTCSDSKYSVTTSFYNETCDEKNKTSHEVSLSLFASGNFIICNSSNPVSSEEIKQNITDMQALCSPKGLSTQTYTHSSTLDHQERNSRYYYLTVLPVLFILFIIIYIVVKKRCREKEENSYTFIELFTGLLQGMVNSWKNTQQMIFTKKLSERRKRDHQTGNTVYEEVKESKPREFEMTSREKADLPQTVYSTVSAVPGTQAMKSPSSHDDDNVYETTADEGRNYNDVECIKPQTIYATVSKNGTAISQD